jgi:hypothetical protein
LRSFGLPVLNLNPHDLITVRKMRKLFLSPRMFVLYVALLALATVLLNGQLHFAQYALMKLNQREPLLYRNRSGGWTEVSETMPSDLTALAETEIADSRFRFSRLRLKRILPFCLNIFEFDPVSFRFETVFQEAFRPAAAPEIMDRRPEISFLINANHFDKSNRPLGWVCHGSREYNPESSIYTGYFLVTSSGAPFCLTRSLVGQFRGDVVEAAQCNSLIKNGRIFDYILDRSNRFRGDTEITYRALGGMKEDGTIVFIVSDNSGGIDLRDLSLIARNFGVSQAIMFDGGSSLQYSLRYNGYSRDFRAFWKKVPIFIGVSPRMTDKAALIPNSLGIIP